MEIYNLELRKATPDQLPMQHTLQITQQKTMQQGLYGKVAHRGKVERHAPRVQLKLLQMTALQPMQAIMRLMVVLRSMEPTVVTVMLE